MFAIAPTDLKRQARIFRDGATRRRVSVPAAADLALWNPGDVAVVGALLLLALAFTAHRRRQAAAGANGISSALRGFRLL
jgi:hypothetical protein